MEGLLLRRPARARPRRDRVLHREKGRDHPLARVAPKRLEFTVTERLGEPLRCEPDWSAEHLLLAGLARCSLTSLDFHAKRRGIRVAGVAEADGVVTKRDEDGRYAFVEVRARLDVELDPLPDGESVAELLELAERDCFIGASLTAPPYYVWRVNGEDVG